MSLILIDGTGKGTTAKIGSDNRLHVNAVSLDNLVQSIIDGDAFVVTTSEVTLTSANASAILHVQNTSSEDMVVSEISVSLGASTGGSGTATLTQYRNPTGGTIVSGATDATVSNRNFSSVNTLVATAYEGDEAVTTTGGTVYGIASLASPSFTLSTSPTVLGPGSSTSFTITPPTGNTSMTVSMTIGIYVDGFGE